MLKKKYSIILGSITLILLLAGTKIYYEGEKASIEKAQILENQQITVQAMADSAGAEKQHSADQLDDIIRKDLGRTGSTYNRSGDVRNQPPFKNGDETVLTAEPKEDKEKEIKIRLEDSGEAVITLQSNLKKLGFFKEEVSGFFGLATHEAVLNFQAQLGIMPDGIAGDETLKKLEYAIEKGILAKEPEQKKTDSESKKDLSSSRSTNQASGGKTVQSQSKSSDSKPVQQSENSSKESKGTVELVSWFGGAENILAIGDTAKIIDVDTGLTFKVKRTYGYNHADVETSTSSDTDIIKKIYGGDFSWSRRAVIVEVNGRRLAASLAAMPHAGVDSKPANDTVSGRSGGYGTGDNLDAVKGNGMDGVLDLHFNKSRTHGTNKVDSQHQAMIQKAYKSGK